MFEPERCQLDSIRDIDKRCIEELGIPGLILMEHASIGIALCAKHIFEKSGDSTSGQKISIFCGPGGNGGDGFAVARHLHSLGAEVQIFDLAPESKHQDRQINRVICQRLKIPTQPQITTDDIESYKDSTLAIDAILGSGIDRPPEGLLQQAIAGINTLDCPVLSVDVPSGLMADSGSTPGEVIQATLTATLCLPKSGFLSPKARQLVGEVWICPIGAPPSLLHGNAPTFPPTPIPLQLKPGFPPRSR
ncbi:MAG: NAD(P)H-hydrate epimerase [Planctomycetota bacterium]